MFLMSMATPATWDPIMEPMSVAAALMRQAGECARRMSPCTMGHQVLRLCMEVVHIMPDAQTVRM